MVQWLVVRRPTKRLTAKPSVSGKTDVQLPHVPGFKVEGTLQSAGPIPGQARAVRPDIPAPVLSHPPRKRGLD